MAAERVSGAGVTVVGRARWERALIWGGFPVAGAVLGGLVWLVAGWVVALRWVPMRGPFELVDSLPDLPAALGCMGLGAVAGLVLAFVAEREYVTVAVGDDRVVCVRDGAERSVPRASVGAVFVDEGRLVLLDRRGRELLVYSAREGADLPGAERLARAFKAHGYPWSPGGDPHRDEYRRWVPDMPGLPSRTRCCAPGPKHWTAGTGRRRRSFARSWGGWAWSSGRTARNASSGAASRRLWGEPGVRLLGRRSPPRAERAGRAVEEERSFSAAGRRRGRRWRASRRSPRTRGRAWSR